MAAIASTATGDFSVGATWIGGVAPTEGDTCTIENGHVVTIDATITVGDDSATAALDILSGGELDWDNGGDDVLTLKGNMYVRNGGTLTLDGTGNGANTLTIELNFSDAPADGKYGMIVEDGATIDCDGFNKTRSWDTLSADAAAAQKVVVTTNDNSAIWGAGDEFVVGSMSESGKGGAETDTIGSFATTSITKAGANYSYAHEENVAFINLTRNVVFISETTTSEGYIYITNNSDGNVVFDWCEFSYLGMNAVNKYGVTLTTNDWATFNYCAFHHCYRGLTGTGNTPIWTIDNCVFGKNAVYDILNAHADASISNIACLGSDSRGAYRLLNSSISDSHFGNCDLQGCSGWANYAVTDCYFYANGTSWSSVLGTLATFDNCYWDGNTIGAELVGAISRITDSFFGATVANTTDIDSETIVIGTGVNTTALTVTVTGSPDNRVSIEDDSNNHKTWKVVGTYEKQASVKRAGSNAVLMNPTDGASPLIGRGTVFATNGETVAYSCYMRKSVAMATLPFVRLSGKGITASTATMVNTQDDWQLMNVSGIATSDGFCKLELVCQNGSGNVYVDDDQDSYTFWFEGDLPPVVPKPSLTANDLLNAMIQGSTYSQGTFGQTMRKFRSTLGRL